MKSCRMVLPVFVILGPAIVAPIAMATTAVHPANDTHHVSLQDKLEALAQRARPGELGVAVIDLQSKDRWRVNADRALPMMSVFKAPVAAAALDRIDRGVLSMAQAVTVERADLGTGAANSSIAAHFHGERMSFTVRELLAAAVSRSDNIAVNALMRAVGGPQVVTAFLRAHGIADMRVDLDEAGIGRIFEDLGSDQKPAPGETAQEEDRRLQRGYRAFLADPRNRSTPDAAADFLRKLWRNELLTPASTRHLIDLLTAQTVPRRLRNGLPAGVRLADKCGTSYTLDNLTAAYNDIGILTWPDGRSVIVAAFLTASPASKTERDAIFAELARTVATSLHP
jgi:beta-lactamase class A